MPLSGIKRSAGGGGSWVEVQPPCHALTQPLLQKKDKKRKRERKKKKQPKMKRKAKIEYLPQPPSLGNILLKKKSGKKL